MKLDEMKKLYCPIIRAKCKSKGCMFCLKHTLSKDSFYCGYGENFW